MNKQRGGRNNHGKYGKSKEQRAENTIDENNPIQQSFRQYASLLDEKHDRHERLVKLSRDITIESKRIIFLLHTIDDRKKNHAAVLEEAEQRLNKVIEVNFKEVAKELLGHDFYQYRNAYSAGLQEFIEAYSFMQFLKADGAVIDWQGLEEKMQYNDLPTVETEVKTECEESKEQCSDEAIQYSFHVDPHEYILGLSDLTGELMRRCINSLGSGETTVCIDTCKALQLFYSGYVSLSLQRSRELSRKIYTMRQSVLKAENVCYNVKVRGGEAAKWGAFETKPHDDIDEGLFLH